MEKQPYLCNIACKHRKWKIKTIYDFLIFIEICNNIVIDDRSNAVLQRLITQQQR